MVSGEEIRGTDLYEVALAHRRSHARAALYHDAWMTTCWLVEEAIQDRAIRVAFWIFVAISIGLVAGWIIYGGAR